jgi:Xaa-Pro aminopeptidase
MKHLNVDAIIIPTNDPHFSEYVADKYKCREWLTGFSGSAGTAVVTQDHAALFTDSRYFLQAEEQLQDSGFELKKEGLPETESIAEYIKNALSEDGTVAIDGNLYTIATFEALKEEINPLILTVIDDPFNEVWENRPSAPKEKTFILNIKYTGKSTIEKFQKIKNRIKPEKNSIYVASMLDEIAWLTNMRGKDVAYTPVFISFAVLDFDADRTHLFVDKSKLSEEAVNHLSSQNISIHNYDDFNLTLAELCKEKITIVNPSKISVKTYQIVESNSARVANEGDSAGSITSLKAVKNEMEIAGIHESMIDDGISWLKFWKWLEDNIDSKSVTEINAGAELKLIRSTVSKVFIEESFAPIVAYKEHGAIVHYSATSKSNMALGREGFILIDTGAQYQCGTTDITRTLHLGAPSLEERIDYTLVLKGHIQLTLAQFPYGTRGAQLDMLARQPMMQYHINYLHGTGHGVGYCLSVHEGPQNIRLNENPTILEVGMLTSCEPGIYRAGKDGIRIENLLLTVRSGVSDFGEFLAFEPVTICPYDLNSIEVSMLSPAEKEFINSYHEWVQKKLSYYLNTSELAFLKEKTKPIE